LRICTFVNVELLISVSRLVFSSEIYPWRVEGCIKEFNVTFMSKRMLVHQLIVIKMSVKSYIALPTLPLIWIQFHSSDQSSFKFISPFDSVTKSISNIIILNEQRNLWFSSIINNNFRSCLDVTFIGIGKNSKIIFEMEYSFL